MKAKDLAKVLNDSFSFTIDINGVSITDQWAIYHSYILPTETYRLVRVLVYKNANHRVIKVKATDTKNFGSFPKQDPRSVKSILKNLTSYKSDNLYMARYYFAE
jgi:hypothetical protein